jgi:SGNH hydrolase-like domain, acetyltransferase AlgX
LIDMPSEVEPLAPSEGKPPSLAPSASAATGWRGKALRAAIGVVLGLALAEGAAYWRDGGAFPHLNVYEADARFGARLRPGATERISFSGNPITSVRINRQGFRGADFPPPSAGETLVLGDSQTFGLGVEEGETFSARLEQRLGGRVINAGVPTYGPLEFQLLLEGLLPERRPRTVIMVLNLANDLFEVDRPNTARHAVWDGWAVRKETAPQSVVDFPGRSLLYGQSHAFYALRGYWHRRSARADDGGFASEGTWHDLVRASSDVEAARELAAQQTVELAKARRAQADEAAWRAREAQHDLEAVVFKAHPELADTNEGAAYRQTHGDPVDIVVTRNVYSEAARDPIRTAQVLVKGAIARQKIEATIRELERSHRGDEVAKAIGDSLARREAWATRQQELRGPAPVVAPRSPLSAALEKAKATCDAAGAQLLVVALPLDVQVSSAEWAKYHVIETIDMAPTMALIEDVTSAAEAAGAASLDATPALRAAEPGAFLYGDLHMTPKGHQALADAIAAKLAPP